MLDEVCLIHINELIPGNVAVPSSERSTTTASSDPSSVKKNTGELVVQKSLV